MGSVQCHGAVNVKKIKGAADKSSDVDGKCKWTLRLLCRRWSHKVVATLFRFIKSYSVDFDWKIRT